MPGAAKRKLPTKKKTGSVTKKRKTSRRDGFINPNASKPEVKFLDTFTDNEPFYNVTNPHTTCNNMLVGSNNYNRVGTKVQLKGLEYQFVVYRTAAGVTNTFPSAVRVVIVYDKEPIAGSTAQWTDVFASQDSAGASFSNTFFNKPNVSEKDRFLILYEMLSLPQVDANVIGPAGVMAWDSAQGMHRKGYIKLKGLITQFNNSSQFTEGAILCYAINNNSTCTNNATTPYGIQYGFRLSYNDF